MAASPAVIEEPRAKTPDVPKITVRLSPDLYRRVKVTAAATNTKLNQFLISALTEAVDDHAEAVYEAMKDSPAQQAQSLGPAISTQLFPGKIFSPP